MFNRFTVRFIQLVNLEAKNNMEPKGNPAKWWLVVFLVFVSYLGIYAIVEAVKYYNFGDIEVRSFPDSVPSWLVIFFKYTPLVSLALPGLVAGVLAKSNALKAVLVGLLLAVPVEFFYGATFSGGPIMLLIGIEKMLYYFIPVLISNLLVTFVVTKIRKNL